MRAEAARGCCNGARTDHVDERTPVAVWNTLTVQRIREPIPRAEAMLEWHCEDNDDPNWEEDFNSGQKIGVIILLLAASVWGVLASLAIGLTDQAAAPVIWFP